MEGGEEGLDDDWVARGEAGIGATILPFTIPYSCSRIILVNR